MTKARKRCLNFLAWTAVCLFPSILWAETLRFATIDYCPFTCDPAKAGGKEGFMTDVLRLAFEPAGYRIELEMLPYVRAVEAVREGNFDGIVVVGKDYAPDFIYPDRPTVIQRVAFLVNADTQWRYTGVESLRHVTVGIVRGYHYVDPDLIAYLADPGNAERVNVIHGSNTTQRGLRMLRRERITTFLEGEFSALYELDKLGVEEAVTIAGYTTTAFEDYTGFSPGNPNADRYAQILSATLSKLTRSGRLADLLSPYGIHQ